MATQKEVYALQPLGLELCIYGQTDAFEPIGHVKEGTFNIVQEDPETIEFNSDFQDGPVIEKNKLGKFTITGDCMSVAPNIAERLLGATVTYVGEGADRKAKVALPTIAKYMYYSLKIKMQEGIEEINIDKAQVVSTFLMEDVKNNLATIRFKFSVLVPLDKIDDYFTYTVPAPTIP